MTFTTHSAAETEALGERLAARLTGGEVIAYTGDLGAGKTAFTRGLARGLGITDRVTSPTFTIVNEYEGGRLPLFHFDMYRLSSSDELYDIGWEDYLARGGICAVEWSENVSDAMEPGTITISIRRGDDDNSRVIGIEPDRTKDSRRRTSNRAKVSSNGRSCASIRSSVIPRFS